MEGPDLSVPTAALKPATVESLADQLNPKKYLKSENGQLRDWRGLYELCDIHSEYGPNAFGRIDSSSNPFKELMAIISKTRKVTVQKILEHLELMDRYDVIDDNLEKIREDVVCLSKIPANKSTDPTILTDDDQTNVALNRPLAHYDAFVLYDDSDFEQAVDMINMMQEKGFHVCTKDKLIGGVFEHEAVMELVTERCNRLVLACSPALLESSYNQFIISFTQATAIRQQVSRKLICVIVKDCPKLPHHLSIYSNLHRSNPFFETRLCKAISDNYKPSSEANKGPASVYSKRSSVAESQPSPTAPSAVTPPTTAVPSHKSPSSSVKTKPKLAQKSFPEFSSVIFDTGPKKGSGSSAVSPPETPIEEYLDGMSSPPDSGLLLPSSDARPNGLTKVSKKLESSVNWMSEKVERLKLKNKSTKKMRVRESAC